ncbi:hypothetical protein HYS31_04130 [Candidatus Woesearchaeota archaeon]|nr:hypothetical protein [Candidatus Woesearchaeota archaeon]
MAPLAQMIREEVVRPPLGNENLVINDLELKLRELESQGRIKPKPRSLGDRQPYKVGQYCTIGEQYGKATDVILYIPLGQAGPMTSLYHVGSDSEDNNRVFLWDSLSKAERVYTLQGLIAAGKFLQSRGVPPDFAFDRLELLTSVDTHESSVILAVYKGFSNPDERYMVVTGRDEKGQIEQRELNNFKLSSDARMKQIETIRGGVSSFGFTDAILCEEIRKVHQFPLRAVTHFDPKFPEYQLVYGHLRAA